MGANIIMNSNSNQVEIGHLLGSPEKSSLETEFFICCNGETLQWSPGKLWLTGNLMMFKEEVSETLSMDSHGASLLRRPTQDPSMAHVES